MSRRCQIIRLLKAIYIPSVMLVQSRHNVSAVNRASANSFIGSLQQTWPFGREENASPGPGCHVLQHGWDLHASVLSNKSGEVFAESRLSGILP